MFSATYKKRLATALAGAALASAMVVSGASADPFTDSERQKVEQFQSHQDLRAPDTRDAAEGYQPELPQQPVADEPSEPSGFDLVSAAIGAVAAGAIGLVLMAAVGLRTRPRGRPASA
jgi:hypothetical protein